MFKDKVFNKALLFSALWHLFWISAVIIIVTPTVQPSTMYQEVGFLGPILEKTAFDLMVDEVMPQAETLYARGATFVDKIYLKPKGPKRRILKKSIPKTETENFSFVLEKYIKGAKEIPLYVSEKIKMIYATPEPEINPLAVQGPAGKREIIFKPRPPVAPKGIYGETDKYTIKLKFFVSNKGIVRDVEPVVSSGYPEIDMKAVTFLKNWRFSSLSAAKRDTLTWGAVTIKIDTEKND
ncbi:MAG: energy transducer TonB [Candidatus Omnitrophota bacterium]